MKQFIRACMAVSVVVLFMPGCSKDERTVSPPAPGNEFLTTVRITATNTADASDVQAASVTDTTLIASPADSINHPAMALKANAVYTVTVEFLDETAKPAGNITDDIYARRNYHLICWEPQNGLQLAIQRTDLDTNTPALEIGLQDKFSTGAAGTGKLNLQLRHQPNAKNGDCAPGSSDADVNFTITIK
jgi:hypothetical protein